MGSENLSSGLLWCVAMALALVCVTGCDQVRKALYRPQIQVKCEVMKNRCRFVNFGDPGEACVRVGVFHFASGKVLQSEPVCSGRIGRDHPVWEEIVFSGDNPLHTCMGEQLHLSFKKECKVEIVELEDR